ncbi:RagB/SusD family nutrient uptake outer membrane protein [Pedobacter mucosus]|uniref:RagB/SusD family nutrient uptake outer membrane protein n=1 Tax=Pedobacter mucosus TaxID=2895286 RepID=UPI001EE3AEF6|nr:RagB/SusD family nutrient uptake outer membrane protein [Pedobacter mucosus]UKT64938.1 RagB/SusD family nutrient uptake outer membrane protein [Pedobacter mucosus]
MKKLITNKYLALIMLCLLSVTSCKKFLDEKPLASSSEEAVFENPNTALMALLGVYNQLAGDNAFGQRLSLIFPFDTDEMTGYKNGTDDQYLLNTYNTTSSNSLLANVYNQLFNGVERANICIYNIPRMAMYTNGTEAQKRDLQRLHGEALTLRAVFYFELIKLWGDLPAHWEPTTTTNEYNRPKTNRDLIYDRLIADLKTASTLVPWRGEVASDERITKGAVKALRARLAMFRGGYALRSETNQMERRTDYLSYYAIARDECAEIMQRTDIHNLNPSFESVFRDALLGHRIEPNGEVLFEVAMAGNDADSDSKNGSYNSVPIGNGTTSIVYFGNYRNRMLPTLFYAYSQFDKRRDVSIAPFSVVNDNHIGLPMAGTATVGLYDGKWRRTWLTPAIPTTTNLGHFGINWPMIRYSDVLLMYAEAVNGITGVTPEAIEAVNLVRRRSWNSNALKNVTVINGGSNFTTAPIVTITGGGGTGASALATIDATTRRVTRIDVVNLGSGYTTAPTITISGGAGTGATATAAVTTLSEANLTSTQTSSPSSFLEAIQQERLLEFASEAIRKYDLIRWNLLASKIAETKTELIKMETRAAPYDAYALRMFYLPNSKTGIVWGNSFYAPAPATVTGYTGINWIASVTAPLIREKFAVSFVINKSEILPLPLHVITNSGGVIKQDYGY